MHKTNNFHKSKRNTDDSFSSSFHLAEIACTKLEMQRIKNSLFICLCQDIFGVHSFLLCSYFLVVCFFFVVVVLFFGLLCKLCFSFHSFCMTFCLFYVCVCVSVKTVYKNFRYGVVSLHHLVFWSFCLSSNHRKWCVGNHHFSRLFENSLSTATPPSCLTRKKKKTPRKLNRDSSIVQFFSFSRSCSCLVRF